MALRWSVSMALALAGRAALAQEASTPTPTPTAKPTPTAPSSTTPQKPVDKAADYHDQPHDGRFEFGSYGRMTASSDGSGRPARDSNIVAYGSRVDLDNYVELELRREDHWQTVGAYTRMVATLAVESPMFHYNGQFSVAEAVRNLYLEELNLGAKGLSVWAGSRMVRGDDIYLLNFWPLDNLNTIGGGARYEAPNCREKHSRFCTIAQVHAGVQQPANPFYKQEVDRPVPLNGFGAATVDILDRQQWVASARIEQQFSVGNSVANRGGVKLIGYGEAHRLPAGQRETAQSGVYEDVPSDTGFVIGAEAGAWAGERDIHLNLFARYASGLAAYGEFANPDGLAPDHSTTGAHELLVAFGGNWEYDRFSVMVGGYVRSFRNASPSLNVGDVDEGILIARPHVWFTDWAGIAVEGSFQMLQRGVLVQLPNQTAPQPLVAKMPRVALIPFLSPAGRGSYSRPMIWFLYSAGFRDDGAKALYPVDDPFHDRTIEQFIGFGAEWWFNSTSYGGVSE